MGGDRYRASWRGCTWRQNFALLAAVASIGFWLQAVNAQNTNSRVKQPVVWNRPAESTKPDSNETVPQQLGQPQKSQFSFFNVVAAPQTQPQPNSSSSGAETRPFAANATTSETPDESAGASEAGPSQFNFFNVTSNAPAQSRMSTPRPSEMESQFQADATSEMNSSSGSRTELSNDDFFQSVTSSSSQPIQKNLGQTEPTRVQPSSYAAPRLADQNADAAENTSSQFNFFNVVPKATRNTPAPAANSFVDPAQSRNPANTVRRTNPINPEMTQPRQDAGPQRANFFNVVSKAPSPSSPNDPYASEDSLSRRVQQETAGFFNIVTKQPAPFSNGYNAAPPHVSNNNFRPVSLAFQDEQPEKNGEQPSSSDLASSDTQLGTAPPSNELVFLRRQTVLLAEGQTQFETGFAYSHLDDDRPIAVLNGGGDVIGVVEARTRQRLLVAPFEIRYGLTDRIQLFANTVVGYSNAELAFNTVSQTQDIGGIGDSNAGMSVLLKTGECDSPDVVFTLGTTAPTGNDSFITSNLVPNSQLGQGFWAIYGNLLFVHTWDPIVVFYGGGYNHRFDHTFVGINVNPGEEFDYQLGVGFAVNSNVSLSGSFQGAYITQFHANGDLIEGSTLEPMRTRLAVTVARNCRIWEPFVEIPMTDDAAARVGMTWTY